MGLPIWRNPEETKPTVKDALKVDPTAAGRSSIRRQASIHGGRNARPRPRLTRDGTVRLPRSARSPPPPAGYSYVRDTPRSSISNGVPPISTLLESADRHRTALPPPPPPPVPESRNYYEQLEAAADGRGDATSSLVALRDTAARLDRQTEYMRQRLQQRMQRSREPDGPLDARDQASRGPPRPDLGPRARADRPIIDGPLDRVTIPNPSRTGSHVEDDSLFLPPTRSTRRSHPLRNSWSPDSPPAVDGLGDRNRSPTPPDGWEIMRSTITPDATLPSAESSFTSAAASQSFASAADTTITEPEVASSSTTHSRRNSSGVDDESDSVSSVDPEDMCDDDDQMTGAEAMAEFMYNHEMHSHEGRGRVVHHSEQRLREGNRFALAHESAMIDIGFRLIEEALETEEGRARLVQVGVLAQCEDSDDENSTVRTQRQLRSRTDRLSRRQAEADLTALDDPPSPQPDRYGEAALAASREARRSTREYFLRYTNGFTGARRPTPPPDYEALTSHPDVEIFTSRDEPVPQPVSPPTQRGQTEVADAILSGDETDLAAMRRVVERLARRDDVPEEWWSSIGLNLSRSRPRSRSPARAERATDAAGQRVRSGRIERRNSRL
ncbi:hypothetical protein LTR86_001181 [Recurvomyces mirabilis]|nr:hypothetical protein LTR86_001181 [Recurvomyces mirabilis]